ncbi:MAG: SurA N-terminal domain-containing protein, partial [Calditrichia bacterium]
MRKLVVLVLSLTVFLITCSKKSEKVKLEPGTPAYELAVAFSEKFDYLDPEKNNILVKTDKFEISTGEVVRQMQRIYGQRIEQLKQLPPNRLKEIIENNAKDLAERKLLVNTAMENNITLSDTAVDSVLSIQYRSAGSKEKYLEFIASHNLNLDEVKEDISKQLMVQRYLNRYLADQSEVTEDDIQKAYNEDKTASVQHILLMTQGKTEEGKAQIRKKMEGILEEARAGADFGELAK